LDRQLVKLTGDLALFTAGLFAATIALFLATAGLAYFAFQQSRDMKASIEIAAKNATAAELNARRSPSSTSMSIPAVRLSWVSSRTQGEDLSANQRINAMQSKSPMRLSRRCGARTRSGSRCRSPAMPNGRCRMHGGTSPGAPMGNKNAFKHGHYTAEAIAERREISALLRAMKALTKDVQ
jgi:hypothetical protein